MKKRLCIAVVTLAACKQPTSYEPAVATRVSIELTFADLSVQKAEMEIDLPEGYRQSSPGIHDAYFERPGEKVHFSVIRLSPIGDLGLHEPRPCGQYPPFAQGLKRLAHEKLGDRGELELCETRDHSGPTDYSVRSFIPVEDNWVECHGTMDPTERDHRRDASHYTEKQREQVMAVCRSMRVVSLGARIPIDQQGRQVR